MRPLPSEVVWIKAGLALMRSVVRARNARTGVPARKVLGGLATLVVTVATLALPAAGGLPAATATATATAAASTAEVGPGVPVPRLQSANPDAKLNALFTSYGNDNSRSDDWTGADSTY